MPGGRQYGQGLPHTDPRAVRRRAAGAEKELHSWSDPHAAFGFDAAAARAAASSFMAASARFSAAFAAAAALAASRLSFRVDTRPISASTGMPAAYARSSRERMRRFINSSSNAAPMPSRVPIITDNTMFNGIFGNTGTSGGMAGLSTAISVWS